MCVTGGSEGILPNPAGLRRLRDFTNTRSDHGMDIDMPDLTPKSGAMRPPHKRLNMNVSLTRAPHVCNVALKPAGTGLSPGPMSYGSMDMEALDAFLNEIHSAKHFSHPLQGAESWDMRPPRATISVSESLSMAMDPLIAGGSIPSSAHAAALDNPPFSSFDFTWSEDGQTPLDLSFSLPELSVSPSAAEKLRQFASTFTGDPHMSMAPPVSLQYDKIWQHRGAAQDPVHVTAGATARVPRAGSITQHLLTRCWLREESPAVPASGLPRTFVSDSGRAGTGIRTPYTCTILENHVQLRPGYLCSMACEQRWVKMAGAVEALKAQLMAAMAWDGYHGSSAVLSLTESAVRSPSSQLLLVRSQPFSSHMHQATSGMPHVREHDNLGQHWYP
jgi:hypothetical protein